MIILSYIKTITRFRKELKKQQDYIRTFLNPYLGELERKYSGKFEDEQLKKIRQYYGLFIPTILCSSYKNLYHENYTEAERKRATLFGILTPVGDDLFDIDKLDVAAINAITYRPESYDAKTFSAHIAREIQSFMLTDVPHRNEYLDAAKDVFEVQLETIKQTDPAIDDKELTRITYAKGGYSVIIYHQIMAKPASKEMWQVLFYVGSLMQFGNDLFDMAKDLRDGITTLPDRCTDYKKLKEIFLDRVKECNRLIYALPYKQHKKEEFAVAMHLIISRSMVVIDKMIQLEQQLGKPLNYATLTRKQLVCDMEKPKNMMRWLYYSYKLPKLT
ncbi:hypothetical protein [Segetibacter aerophilus]|uniref:Uncharacterized protein n=1 Tax=Segetibacter aerophilus TaxID=670293 RepID=A0A512B834_9BACT|nr:hypothetical protein [Segetibacter aerophilus]GEO08118.1 hypothetical protein SAE01_06140 [Segetibacter aerophilus]